MTTDDVSPDYRCGYVALIGRPNAGKSTLLNRILGSKLAITSSRPQTTRNRIAGIHNDAEVQMVLVDTPGIHQPSTELNRVLVQRAIDVLSDVDIVCWIIDGQNHARRLRARQGVLDPLDQHIAQTLKAAGRPVIVGINKIDAFPKNLLLPILEAYAAQWSEVALLPISAETGEGVAELLRELTKRLPIHPPLYPPDVWTQVSERFLASEIIREKVFHLTLQEIPYVTFVDVENFDESERETRDLVRILASIIVERGSQKGIIIGRGGEMLKRIGTLARKELEAMLGCRVYLELNVRAEKKWTRSKRGLKKVGFDREQP